MINCFHLSIFLLHLTVKGQKWKMKKSNVPEVESLTSEIERVHRIQCRKIFHQWRKNSSRVHCVLGKNETGWSIQSLIIWCPKYPDFSWKSPIHTKNKENLKREKTVNWCQHWDDRSLNYLTEIFKAPLG